MQKIKICFVTSALNIGGPASLITSLAVNLDPRIYDRTIVVLTDVVADQYTKVITEHGVRLILLKKPIGGISLLFLAKLKSTINSLKPDAVSSHLSATFYLWLTGITKHFPVSHTVHSLPQYDLRKTYRFFLKRDIKKGRIKIVGCSKQIALLAADLYKVEAIPIQNGIPLHEMEIETIKKDIDFLCVGRIVEMKQYQLVIQAFQEVRKNHPKAILTIVGDGPDKKRLLTYVHDSEIQGVEFVASGVDVSTYYKRSKLHVMASKWEGNPMVILESLSYGVPTLAPSVGGIPDVIRHFENGILFGEPYLQNLIYYMNLLMDDEELLIKLSKNAYKTANEFDIKDCCKKYLRLFEILH